MCSRRPQTFVFSILINLWVSMTYKINFWYCFLTFQQKIIYKTIVEEIVKKFCNKRLIHYLLLERQKSVQKFDFVCEWNSQDVNYSLPTWCCLIANSISHSNSNFNDFFLLISNSQNIGNSCSIFHHSICNYWRSKTERLRGYM